MAGRGRGRGSALSLTHEQLQALGIARGETSATILAPPPIFPKLEAKPLPLNCDGTTEYMLVVKDQFIEFLHESPAYVKTKARTDDVERYSDKYKFLVVGAKQNKILNCVWENMPMELRPQAKRVRAPPRRRKLDDPTEIVKRLQTLEKEETQDESAENMETNEDETRVKAEEGNEEEEVEEEQEQEYEIDDGTDYANNYFDNGEDYDEEDDNLDDGPVY